ncbi:MAG: hypothetical protein Q7K42_06205 [Candidatus Diapherotrites archaeon]|nr:hypothetical protein [Candidatus Diapherotrites archaeon]
MPKKDSKDEEFSDKEEEPKDVYNKAGIEEQLEDDEISPGEAGFMDGYDNPELLQCQKCKKDLNIDKAIEKVVDEETYYFCSKKCADVFSKKD